jgi:diguanylate cyclase (GGDEF)-like protein
MGRKFELTDDVTIGRDDSNAIVIAKSSVSRRHAQVVSRLDRKVIVDLESKNGTFVNETPVTEAELRNGDLIRVGDAIFKFLHGSVEALYHEEIYRLTIIDGLTDAHNKRHLLEHLEREIARCHRYQRPLALLMIDIDYFKRINDTHGHLAGDRVLRELATLVRSRIRREEFFARYGGEEFALVIPEATRSAAVTSAEALRALAADHDFQFNDTRIAVTISIGVGLLDEQVTDPLSLVRAADEKLYQAKNAGRNCVVD